MKYVNDKFLHSDLIVLGCIATINCYILLVMGKIIDGMDVFLKSLSLFQVIGILLSLIIVQTLIELYVRYINKCKTAFLVSRFILGVFVMFMAYILVVTIGCNNRWFIRLRWYYKKYDFMGVLQFNDNRVYVFLFCCCI